MEEREALKRQIELLQSLINKHKSVHGDAPFSAAEPRRPEASAAGSGRGFTTSVFHPHSSRGRAFIPQSRGSWRKTYSLKNKSPQSSVGHPSTSTSFTHHSTSQHGADSISLPGHSRGNETNPTKPTSLPSGNHAQQKKEGPISSTARIKGAVTEKLNTGAAVTQRSSSSTGTSLQHEAPQRKTQQMSERRHVLPGKKVSCSSEVPPPVKANTSTTSQNKASRTSYDASPTITTKTSAVFPAGNTTSTLPAPFIGSKHPLSTHSTYTQVNASFLKKSKFTWVKSQNVELKQASSGSCSGSSPTAKTVSTPASDLKAVVSTGSPSSAAVSKKTPPKKLSRKLSPIIIAPKTSKYKWVSSAGAQARTSRKPLSPKAWTTPPRALERGDSARKAKAASGSSTKLKKGISSSSTSSSLSSRYRWKAGGQSTTAAVMGGPAGARRKSAFHWTAEKSNKGMKVGLVVSPTLPQRAHFPSSSPGGFKLRSRMKIIRRSASSGGGSDKGNSPRGRMHSSTRSPMGARRTPTRELVSFGRHKLRRLSPTFSRTNPTSSFHRSPASQRVFRTRYKMVTRPGSSTVHTHHYNPALSWRTKRIQSARSFLQNRLRAPHDRHPPPAQRWARSEMCWIRGSLYRVSANKLSRTVTANMTINRTGRTSSPHISHMNPALTRFSSTRHLASRAVQRSIAIIRHARQKKQQRQYCMYYNRFGKCKRGTRCPFIHDPDKVAVCTRFLRGTCKQADGVCPFSHKVAKEKMPVCSYFLKGICNNSECPYSHVYVSRKAEVCEDFVKGYCPEGQKCKKKHTLVCPEFSKTGSCPRGSRCKLQHRQRVKRSAGNTPTTPAKKVCTKKPLERLCLSVTLPQDAQATPGTSTAGPLALPSFISLSSSPEEADAPDTLPTDTAQVKEKKLQIKPRL
ncbi:zinc finger CCCH domain-containing protein 3 isoform X2 [Melanotaenia boesemani]|uniref:zinc finger CCCH domain-containing protein 3 isoform X2 n=1 Tax=Melanotaenia boesemani TaxID=1250792 RepID=UPI001C04142C|nr:zinc finger CCCH domain-containing protein 3 isoform X2 [Melanotaenia boesemani]